MTPATLKQQSVLDNVERQVQALPFSPSPALKDLYKDIGEDGKSKALQAIDQARQDVKLASTVIDLFLNRTLTTTVRHLLGENVYRCEKNQGDPCEAANCPNCMGLYK